MWWVTNRIARQGTNMHSSRLDDPSLRAKAIRTVVTVALILAIGLLLGGGIGVGLAKLVHLGLHAVNGGAAG
jgi:hypothetical protein